MSGLVAGRRGEVGGTVPPTESFSAFHANAMLLNESVRVGQVDDFHAE